MKGITPVIALVLLMMITIALAGFTYIWLQATFKQSANRTGTHMQGQQEAIMKRVRIDNAPLVAGPDETEISLAIRNVGEAPIKGSEISVYVNGTLVECDVGDLAPGTVGSCTITCKSGYTVKVTAPGNEDTVTCE